MRVSRQLKAPHVTRREGAEDSVRLDAQFKASKKAFEAFSADEIWRFFEEGGHSYQRSASATVGELRGRISLWLLCDRWTRGRIQA